MSSITKCLKTSKSLQHLCVGGNQFHDEHIKQLLKVLSISQTPLQTLSLGDDVWLSPDCGTLSNQIVLNNPELHIEYLGVRQSTTKTVDFSAILVDRCKFLATKPKKVKLQRNMGHFFATTLRDGPELCTEDELSALIAKFGAKLDQQLVKQMAENWNEKFGKSTKVNLAEMSRYYLQRHPYVLPEVVPEPVNVAAKKGKRAGKSKKSKAK